MTVCRITPNWKPSAIGDIEEFVFYLKMRYSGNTSIFVFKEMAGTEDFERHMCFVTDCRYVFLGARALDACVHTASRTRPL